MWAVFALFSGAVLLPLTVHAVLASPRPPRRLEVSGLKL